MTRPAFGPGLREGRPGRPPSDVCMYDDKCMDEPSGRFAIPICDTHAIGVHALVEMALALERLHANNKAALDQRRPVSEPRERYDQVVENRRHRPVVYYVRFGDMVKIGYSAKLRSRLQAIPHQEVLLVKDGTRADERAAHQACAAWRLVGEWFEDCPEFRAAAGLPPR